MTNRFSFFATVVQAPFAAMIARMRAAYDKHVPIGYEDENGFHPGSKPLSYPETRILKHGLTFPVSEPPSTSSGD
jgi:hypothetical protein